MIIKRKNSNFIKFSDFLVWNFFNSFKFVEFCPQLKYKNKKNIFLNWLKTLCIVLISALRGQHWKGKQNKIMIKLNEMAMLSNLLYL